MSGALLVENELHHEYWRKKTVVPNDPTTITYSGGTAATGHGFENCIDENAGTTFKIANSTQAVITITFPNSLDMNGFCIYGHNLTRSQGITIHYDSNTSGDVDTEFTDAGSIYTNTYKPADNLYKPFGAMWTDGDLTLRRLKITTVGWTTESYISIMSAGMWVTSGINVSAPFTPPNFTPYETTIKRNNKGNPLLSDTRKVPQKLNIKLNNFEESDLEDTTDEAFRTRINGQFKAFSMIDYLGHFMPRFPFFVMYTQGVSGESDSLIAEDRNRLYYCTIDRSLRQPSYSSPTLLNWNINAIGYIE